MPDPTVNYDFVCELISYLDGHSRSLPSVTGREEAERFKLRLGESIAATHNGIIEHGIDHAPDNIETTMTSWQGAPTAAVGGNGSLGMGGAFSSLPDVVATEAANRIAAGLRVGLNLPAPEPAECVGNGLAANDGDPAPFIAAHGDMTIEEVVAATQAETKRADEAEKGWRDAIKALRVVEDECATLTRDLAETSAALKRYEAIGRQGREPVVISGTAAVYAAVYAAVFTSGTSATTAHELAIDASEAWAASQYD